MTTGERIKARRKEIGMSAETLAELCGISPATVYRYEKGDIENMRTDKLTPIADALRVTSAYLMGWEDDEEMKKSPDTLIDVEGLSKAKRSLIKRILDLSDDEVQGLDVIVDQVLALRGN